MGIYSKIKRWVKPLPFLHSPGGRKPDLESVFQKIAVYRRNTWMPVIDEDKQELLGSKIGGNAYVPATEPYPLCPNCSQELSLFLQLNPKDLPENCDLDLEARQLIQLFYCTNQDPHCELECEAYFPFSRSVLARAIPVPAQSPSSPSRKNHQFPEKGIMDWICQEDFPDWHEMQAGGAKLSEQEVELLEASQTGVPKAADKLGGWPYWVQGVEYPSCPECGLQMQMIFQLDSNHHLPYMFGDAGIAHLYQCRLHKKALAFSWAAY